MRRKVPRILALAAGGPMVLGLFVPRPAVQAWQDAVQRWAVLLVAASVLLGVANLFRVNLRRVACRGRDWPYRLALLAALAGMFALGMLHPFAPDTNDTAPGTRFHWAYEAAYVPLQTTLFSLLAFHLASAALRAFRGRPRVATVFALSAAVVLLGRVPPRDAGWLGPRGIGAAQAWVLVVPAVAARRGLVLGAAVGAIALGVRVLLGFEPAGPEEG